MPLGAVADSDRGGGGSFLPGKEPDRERERESQTIERRKKSQIGGEGPLLAPSRRAESPPGRKKK